MVGKWLKQLLVNTRTHQVDAEDNPGANEALDFEQAKLMAPRLGTSDLCRLASSARLFGYELAGVTLRDRAMHPLSTLIDEDLEESICDALREGELSRVHDILRGDRGPLFIVAVVLTDDATGEDVEIGRMGSYQGSSDESLEKLVRPAFKRLQLS